MASRGNGNTGTSTPTKSTASTKAVAKPTTTRKAASEEAAAPKPAAKAATPRKKSTPLGSGGNAVQLTPEERLRYVSEAAYFIAERRGFAAGGDVSDWLQAESEIDRLLAGTTRH